MKNCILKICKQKTVLSFLFALCALAAYAQPANDFCVNAVPVVCGGTYFGNTIGGESAGQINCSGASPAADVWYSYVGDGSTVTVNTCAGADYDTQLFAYIGSCGSLTCVAGNDDACGLSSQISFTTLPGNMYYIAVNGFNGQQGNFQLNITCAPPPGPPINDTCINAITIIPNTTCIGTSEPVDFAFATEQLASTSCSGNTSSSANDVWYKFTANGTDAYTIGVTGNNNFNAVLGLYSGCTAGNLISCMDAQSDNGSEYIITNILPAGTYYYRIYGFNGSTGGFSTCVVNTPPPTNDNCSSAISVTPNFICNATVGSVILATEQFAATNCSGNTSSSANDVWYTFTANGTDYYSISATGNSNLNAVLGLYSACNAGALISCVDAQGDNGTEMIAAGTLAAGTYYYRIYGYNGSLGGFSTCVTITPPVPINDQCTSVTPVSLANSSVVFTGSTVNATGTNDGVLPGISVWHAITLTNACNDVSVRYCGSDPAAVSNIWVVLGTDCPNTNYIFYSSYAQDCPGGIYSVYYNGLPPGTYYIPVLADAGYGIVQGPYQITASAYDCNSNIWTGNVDTDWNTNGNWSNNAVPVAGANVVIPDVSMASNNFPLIGTPVTVNNLTVASGASVDVESTAGLVLDGTLDASAGTFTLQSTNDGTAYLDDYTLGGTVVGNINVQRYSPLGVAGYRQLGTPVQISNISSVSGFTVSGIPGFVIPLPTCNPNYVASNSPYGSWLQLVENAAPQYNCSQSLFQVLTSGGMTNGRGYYMDVAGNSTITFTGAPNTGPISFGLTHANTAVSNGWNMVANPYPSRLAWETANVPAGVDAIGKVWVSSGAYMGTFQDLDANIAGTAVAIGQAFQVRVTVPGSTPSFDVDNTDRTIAPPTYLFAGNNPMTLNIDIMGNGFADITKVRFMDGATTNMDAMFDSPKMLGNANQPMVYSVWGNKNYSTNSYDELNDIYTLPLGVKLATAGQHTLAFSNIDQFPPSTFIYLEDVQTGTMQDVRSTDTYNFTQSAGVNETRFILHFYPPVQKNITDATCDVNGSVVLTEMAPATWDYTLQNAQNIMVSQGVLDASTSITNLPAGNYTLTMTEQTSGYVAVETVTVTGAFQVSAQPQVSVVNPSAGQEIQFTANTQNATAWSWNFGDGNTSIEQNPLHIFNADGNYTVSLTASNSLCDDASTINVSVSAGTAGIQDANLNADVKMWNDNTTVYMEFKSMWEGKTIFTLYDMQGKKVFQKQLLKTSGTVSVDCGNVAAGTYTAEVYGNGMKASRKVIMGTK